VKLIQAMKKLKDLKTKAEDLKGKVAQHCAALNIETPPYPDQTRQVSEWVQAYHDVVKEILRLRVAVQRTNLNTSVTIELDGKQVTKSVAEWIHRRRDLAALDLAVWSALGDKGLREQNLASTAGGPVTEIRIKRFYDPAERDAKLAIYKSEPSVIDGHLEIINATTDLME
jgi:hypothetical protein